MAKDIAKSLNIRLLADNSFSSEESKASEKFYFTKFSFKQTEETLISKDGATEMEQLDYIAGGDGESCVHNTGERSWTEFT